MFMTVAFIGHRNIYSGQALENRLCELIEALIVNKNADTFLFGSKSGFDELCYKVITAVKQKYPQIRRVYVRAEFEHIDGSYRDYLSTLYEETLFPESVHNAGVVSYIKRNEAMIDMCDMVIMYLDDGYVPRAKRYANSGTKLAAEYAAKKNKPLVNVFRKDK